MPRRKERAREVRRGVQTGARHRTDYADVVELPDVFGRFCDECGFVELAHDVELLVEHRRCPRCAA